MTSAFSVHRDTATGSVIYLNRSASCCCDEWTQLLADIVALNGSEWRRSASVCVPSSPCTWGLENLSTLSHENVESKRPAGADVPVKQVELAPATHQLNRLIKMR